MASDLRAAFEMWAGFPVGDHPRPLIFNGDLVRFYGGFPDGITKEAYLRGAIASDVELPYGVLDTLTGHRHSTSGASLRIIAAEASIDEFDTDRGPKPMPCWRLVIAGITAPFFVLDPIVESWWPGPGIPRGWGGGAARLGADGRTLTYTFVGSPGDVASYHGTVIESDVAFAVEPVATRSATDATHLVGARRQVVVSLARPLGNRVLVNDGGQPLTVIVDGW